MSIALMELILEGGPYTLSSVADAFVRVFRRDPRQGYAERFFHLLQECETGTDLLMKIHPKSTRNGAMMRSIPLGYLPDEAAVLRIAFLQASVTHDTYLGKLSSQVFGLMSYHLLRGMEVKDLPGMIRTMLNYSLIPWTERVACDAEQTIRAVLASLQHSTSMSEVLKYAVSLGGDTDSVAAVSLGLASMSPYTVRDLPQFLTDDLETGWGQNHLYGVPFLKDLDARSSRLVLHREIDRVLNP
jgi:ADP-ribosylglycohydrolase